MARALLVSAALLLSPLALADGSSTAASQEAQQVLNQVQAAFNQHDPAKLAQQFASDATVITPDGHRMHGRQQIQTDMARQMRDSFEGTKSNFTLEGTRPIGSNALWVDATHQLTNMKKPDGTRGATTYHVTALLEKQGNQWKIEEVRPYAFQQLSQQGVGGAGSGNK